VQNKRLNSPLYQLSLEEKSLLFSYFPYGIVALDLETTGLSPLVDRIVEIGAIKITPSKFEIFESFINPEIPIPAHTTSIHGITDEMVQNAPKIIEGLNLFNIFLGDLPIVAHNAKFDLGFVVMSLQKHKLSISKSDVY
jgi:DNA polymerase-3 subunit epsilon